jgi:hypothetical protein
MTVDFKSAKGRAAYQVEELPPVRTVTPDLNRHTSLVSSRSFNVSLAAADSWPLQVATELLQTSICVSILPSKQYSQRSTCLSKLRQTKTEASVPALDFDWNRIANNAPADLKAVQHGADKAKSLINEQTHIKSHQANPVRILLATVGFQW